MNPFLRNIQAIESPYSGLPSVIPNFSSAPKVFGMDIGNMSGTSPNTTFAPRSGTMIGADAPEGFGRYWGGFLDIFTGGDADKRGHGGGKKSAEGYGGVAENYETNTKGEITKIPPKKDKYDGRSHLGLPDWFRKGNEPLITKRVVRKIWAGNFIIGVRYYFIQQSYQVI